MSRLDDIKQRRVKEPVYSYLNVQDVDWLVGEVERLTAAQARRTANARLTLAWLMWCYAQGYTHPSDRDILTSWMDDDAAQLHPDDVIERERLLLMADEVLAALDGDGVQE